MREASLARLPALALLVVSLPALSTAVAAQSTPLAGHRAVYELSLEDGATSKAVETARGRILYEFTGTACEGYTQTFAQIVELSGGDIGRRVSATRSTSFEEGDGSILRFNTQNRSPSGETEDRDGVAEKVGPGISVTLKKPAATSFKLDEAMFPTAHVKKIIAAARAGETTLAATVYDGSDKDNRGHDTFAVIGKPVAEGAEEVEPSLRAAGWDKVARWPVSVSYFEPGATNQTPQYIVSFELLENGVSRKLKLDYGEFALKGEITRMEVLPTPACDK
jgi:hypothetical protein